MGTFFLFPVRYADVLHLCRVLQVPTALGLLGIGTSAVPYGVVVSHWFNRRRGLALGCMMLGAGVGGIVVPLLAQRLIGDSEWTGISRSFDGVHFRSGVQADDPANGHNLVVTDDFVYAEPVAQSTGQPSLAASENTAFAGAVYAVPTG